MMRATGFDRIEATLKATRRNVRDAVWSVVWNAPSFIKAKRSYRSLSERIQDVRKIQESTRKAQEDGIITKREEMRLKKLRKREIKCYQREMKRMVNAAASLGKVWKALDLDEVRDTGVAFLFQLMAVLCTGHNETLIGKLISKWCLFLNLGGLFLDTNAKLRYPISKLIHHQNLFSSSSISEKQAAAIETTGQVLMFTSAGYLVVRHNETASALNAAAVSSAIIYRGCRTLVDTFWDREEQDSVWSTGAGLLQGTTGGVVMVVLTAVGMWSQYRQTKEGKPCIVRMWLLRPFLYLEEWIDKLVVVMDKIV